MTIKIRTIVYEPIPEAERPIAKDGFSPYQDGIRALYGRDRFTVVEWCCEDLKGATKDWDGGTNIEFLDWTTRERYPENVKWDGSLDTFTERLIITTGESGTGRAVQSAYRFCPYCGSEIEFEEEGRIVKRPYRLPPDPDPQWEWFSEDEIPWWEVPIKEEENCCENPDCCQGSDPDCQDPECCGYSHEEVP